MDIDILFRPGCSVASVKLEAEETITSEGGAMISMSKDMSIETTTHKKGKGSVLKAIKRVLSGENFFINHFTAPSNGGEIWLAPILPGDMIVHEITSDKKLVVQAGSYLASEQGIEIDFNWQGFKSIFAKENLFWLNLSGEGKVIINSFGAIYPVEIDGDYIVDSGHIVAFEDTLKFKISKAGNNWLHSFLGGEGFVCKFTGKGTVWCQSHHPISFAQKLGRMLRPR